MKKMISCVRSLMKSASILFLIGSPCLGSSCPEVIEEVGYELRLSGSARALLREILDDTRRYENGEQSAFRTDAELSEAIGIAPERIAIFLLAIPKDLRLAREEYFESARPPGFLDRKEVQPSISRPSAARREYIPKWIREGERALRSQGRKISERRPVVTASPPVVERTSESTKDKFIERVLSPKERRYRDSRAPLKKDLYETYLSEISPPPSVPEPLYKESLEVLRQKAVKFARFQVKAYRAGFLNTVASCAQIARLLHLDQFVEDAPDQVRRWLAKDLTKLERRVRAEAVGD